MEKILSSSSLKQRHDLISNKYMCIYYTFQRSVGLRMVGFVVEKNYIHAMWFVYNTAGLIKVTLRHNFTLGLRADF